jgi:putative transposon-encoded protein
MKKIKIDTKSKLVLENIDGFVKRKVTKFGNSAKVDCPKEHLGKEVFLVFIKNKRNKD